MERMPLEKHALLDSVTASTERPLLVPHAPVDSEPALMAKMPTEKHALPPSTELPALMERMPTEKHALLDSVTASTERPLLVPHALVDSVPALMAKMPTEKHALPPSTE